MDTVKPFQIYRHFKGNLYQIVCIAENSESGKKEVIYRALYGDNRIYARDLDMFISDVDKEKYPDVKQIKRFEPVDIADVLKQPDDKQPGDKNSEINPVLLKFLDASGYEQQLECLTMIREDLTEEILVPIELSLGMEEQKGSIDDRYRGIKNYINLKQRYEKSSRV